MTGSQKSNTLTRSDRDNLEKYLNADRKLWLIGEGIGNHGSASSWVESHMNVDFPDDHLDSKPESPMVGNDIPFQSDEEFYFEEQFAEDSDKIYSASGANESLEDDSGDCYMVSYDAPKRGGERTVFQSFTFSSLNEELSGSRTRLAYKVIMWLGNMSKRSGNDLAVSSQEISDPSPKYMDTLNISATIRNNGNESLTTEAVLEIDGSIVNQTEPFVIDSEGTTSVNFKWLADELGRHEVLVIVDPFNEIEENNELNNDISYQNGIPEINVEFTTLIVDDDHEDEKSKNSTYYVENAYKSLDYTYDMFYSSKEESGPHVDEMKYYNSVCWVTGSVDDPFDHYENGLNIDIDNITKYLEEYESNFILIGDRVLNNIPEDFREDKLNIESDGSSIYSPPSLLKGVKEDPITHGFEYRLKEEISTDPYHYNIMNGAKPIFESKNNYTYSHRYQDHSSNYKLTYLGVDPMHFKRAFRVDDEKNETEWYKEYDYVLNGTPMREELFYKINQWFGQYDDRIELRVSDIDVEVSTKHPTLVIGSSFVIRAKIENMGGTEADALIRFKDGDTHIKTESMYLPAHSRKTIEVKWKPVHAGEDRPVRVIVDPLGEVGEIPNDPGSNNQKDHLGFNNQAIIYTDVFYFWDDMENGTANWQHETNLAQINGEVPLDYMSGQYGSLDTDIASEWESNESVEKVDWDSHSDPNSYLMEETEGTIEGEADVFLGIVLDNSHSMANRHYPEGEDNPTWLDHAKEGAISLVNSLSNKSVVCVWNFSGQNVAQAVQPTQLTENGRQNVISGIYGIEEKPITSIWDATGNAYMDVINNIDNYDQDLMPAVTILGDGGDIHSADGSANLKMLESGSKDWAPWGKMKPEQNYTEEEYPSHLGKYQFPYNDYTPSDNGEWLRANGERGGPQYEPYRKGLLYSDIPIYTIGLGVEHFDNIPNWEEVTTYDEPDDGDVNQYDVYKNPSGPNAPKNKEAGTLEYNLWRIATTSDAEYFFAPDPKNLTNIFSQIGQLIAKPGNVTSVDMNDNSIKSWDNPNPKEVENKDKWAVTPEIDIEDMDSAYLTFWHKYKLLNGVNGGFIELNYTEHNEWQGWKYVKPSIGPYSGNLFLSGDLPKDDHNNEIRWCWNGRSADGTLDWEYARVNLFRHIPDDAEKMKVRFYYKQYGGSNEPGGWLIDDVGITASRKGDSYYDVPEEQMDVWQYVSENGNQAWYNGINYNDPEQQRFKGGIDNRLISSGIDLTNARTAKLSADFKFNINEKSGRPPDGFRVEITTDNGITWESINLGSRAASGYSDGWVSAEEGNNSLTRLLLDLSD
ncbi:MAG: CARDB domain-containing protein, partial [Thermoplasmatota archaeon]